MKSERCAEKASGKNELFGDGEIEIFTHNRCNSLSPFMIKIIKIQIFRFFHAEVKEREETIFNIGTKSKESEC